MAGFRHEGIERLEALVCEAALDPDLRHAFACEAAEASGSAGAMLFRFDRIARPAIATPSMDRCGERCSAQGWNRIDHRLNGLSRMRERGTTIEQDSTTAEQFETLPFCRDLPNSHGLRWFAVVGFAEPSDEAWCLALRRSPAQGPFPAPGRKAWPGSPRRCAGRRASCR